MRMTRTRRWALWLTTFVVWFATLAPTVSHALSRVGEARWVEVCTAQGSRWIDMSDEDTRSPDALAGVLDHCPFCPLGHGMAPPPPAVFAAPTLAREGVAARLCSDSPTPGVWCAPPTRAPPVLT